jgi:GTP1/Obg family GTP-binding protein
MIPFDIKQYRRLPVATVQISARIDKALKQAIDRLEDLEDGEDVARLRREATRPLADVLRELKLDGQL